MNGLPIAGVLPAQTADRGADRVAALVDAHYDRLYRLARRLVSSADEALDLVQETFLKAARSARSIPAGASAEEAWLVRVLVNLRRDEWRKSVVRRRYDDQAKAAAVPAHDSEAGYIAHAMVWRALDALTPRRRAVLILHELEGADVPAIASLLGVSRITVRWHLSKARRDLARVLRG
jgi:RNA polymerase sigma-70 factor (ECF subfamily)